MWQHQSTKSTSIFCWCWIDALTLAMVDHGLSSLSRVWPSPSLLEIRACCNFPVWKARSRRETRVPSELPALPIGQVPHAGDSSGSWTQYNMVKTDFIDFIDFIVGFIWQSNTYSVHYWTKTAPSLCLVSPMFSSRMQLPWMFMVPSSCRTCFPNFCSCPACCNRWAEGGAQDIAKHVTAGWEVWQETWVSNQLGWFDGQIGYELNIHELNTCHFLRSYQPVDFRYQPMLVPLVPRVPPHTFWMWHH